MNRGDLEAPAGWPPGLPVVRATYAEPFLDGHNRMKEALAILGGIDEALFPSPTPAHPRRREREKIRRVVTKPGCLARAAERPEAALGRHQLGRKPRAASNLPYSSATPWLPVQRRQYPRYRLCLLSEPRLRLRTPNLRRRRTRLKNVFSLNG